jgi:hypothetical protein
MVWWLPSWKFCFWWCFSSVSRTTGYPMPPIIQATLASHVWWALRFEVVSDELRSNYIFLWGQYSSHGEILRRGSQECCANLVLLPSAKNNHIMAEAKGHADHQFPRVLDEAGYCSSFVPVHTRPQRIPTGVCLKVLASEGTSAHSAQWNRHWGHDQGSSARTYSSILRQEAPSDSGEAASENGRVHPGRQWFLPKKGGSL